MIRIVVPLPYEFQPVAACVVEAVTIVEIIMTNGMSRTMTATAGRNVYPASKGINIVRVDGKVSKLSL